MSSEDMRSYWDAQAATFDEEADHGLADPVTKDAWAARFDDFLRDPTCAVVDLGCGTGSVSMLLAQRGHRVLGIDLAPNMIERAQHKANRVEVDAEFMVGDVETVATPEAYGAVVTRHILWAVSDLDAVVERWTAPLTADGVFVAIEGVWDTAGIEPTEVFSALQPHFQQVRYIDLSGDSALWGKEVTDHRYAVVASRPRHIEPS